MRPVATANQGGTVNTFDVPFFGKPLLMQVMKNLVQPQLTGRYEDWPKFAQDWEIYLGKLSGWRKVSDEQKLQLLEGCLNEVDRNELQLMGKMLGGKLNFSMYWAKLVARYGEQQSTCARRRWHDLELQAQGKLTNKEWRDFKVKFMDIWDDVPGAGDEEAYQILVAKIPSFALQWVIEEQEKRKARTPKANIGPLQGVTPAELETSLEAWTGNRPRYTKETTPGNFTVELGGKPNCRTSSP